MKEDNKIHECAVYDSNIAQTISFRPASYEKDLHTLFDWMHQKHVYPFWNLNLPMDKFKEFVKNSVEAQHKRVFMGFIDGDPVCYLIAYSMNHDNLRNYYDVQPGDLGMHLLIGERDYLNKKYGQSIIAAMSLFVFKKFGASRIVGEPDHRNRIIIPILKSLGVHVIGTLELPNKTAKLVSGDREHVLSIINQRTYTATWHLPSSPQEEWLSMSGEREASCES